MIHKLFRYENPPVSSVTFVAVIAAVLSVELFGLYCNSKQFIRPVILLGCIRLLQILLIISIVGCYQQNYQTIGLSRSKIVEGIRQGMIWSLCFGVIMLMPALVLLIAGINPLKFFGQPKQADLWTYGYLLLLSGIIGPVAEELFFRGILYGFFRQWGFAAALIVSNLVFIPLHNNISLFQLVGGVLFAVSYEFRGNLLVPLCIHILGNSAIYALSLINFVYWGSWG